MTNKMKGRDLESLMFAGKLVSVKLEYCDDEKKEAKVIGITNDGEEVETECIPTRAAGKISVVIKHYLKMGLGNIIITEQKETTRNVDMEPEESEQK
ncbi:MAG: hypothetical protein QXV69_01650 [Sulfolobaceae archaeon]